MTAAERRPDERRELRAFVLLGFDPATGHATRPVAALAVPPTGEPAVSWLALRSGADEPWRDRLTSRQATDQGSWDDALATWLESPSRTADLVEVQPFAAGADTAAEVLVDMLLAQPAPWSW